MAHALVGRERELADAGRLFEEDVRLLTVAGPPGAGKTHFALALIDLVRSNFDQVGFADLSGGPDLNELIALIGRSVGIEDSGPAGVTERLATLGAGRRTLIVLDSCEHVVERAEVVAGLLESAPGLVFLATSQLPLRLSLEQMLPLPLLNLEDSIELFALRAQVVDPGFEVTARNRPLLEQIAARLEGLPLAIELAAARAGTVPLKEMLARLNHALEFLNRGPQDLPARHRTMRAALEWSHRQLNPEQALLLPRLAIFPGTFSGVAAARVCAAGDLLEERVGDLLAEFVERSLVAFERGPGRYRLLDTVRQFGRSLLEPEVEAALTRRHLDWCLEVATRTWQTWARAEEETAIDELESEGPSLLAAVSAGLEDPALAGSSLQLAWRLWRWWDLRGRVGEGRRLLDALGTKSPPASDFDRMAAMWVSGHLCALNGDVPAASARWLEALPLATALGEKEHEVLIRILIGIGYIYARPEAVSELTAGAERLQPLTPAYLGWLEWIRGGALAATGEHAAAQASYQRALAAFRRAAHPWSVAYGLRALSRLAWLTGEHLRAAELQIQALEIRTRLRDSRGIADSLEVLAWIVASLGSAAEATLLLGAAEAQRELAGAGMIGAASEGHGASEHACLRALGEAAFLRTLEAGRSLTPGECLAMAANLARRDEGSAPVLTEREREIVALLADGLRNRQIAERLGITERTTESHLEHVRGKLGMHSRSEIAVWAVRQGVGFRLSR